MQPDTRAELSRFLDRFESGSDVRFAIEACTGWRYIAEEMTGRGIEVHLAEAADTAVLKDPSGGPRPTGATLVISASC